MDLSSWREAVAYGAYLQPIRLEVVKSNPASSVTPAVHESLPESVQNSRIPSDKSAETSSNGTPVIQQATESSTTLQTGQDAAQSTVEVAGAIMIPPFTSEALNNSEQMALNVGGPVWAMDWLPSKPAANAAAVAAALIKIKEKKPRRSSAGSKKAQKSALKGKENNHADTPDVADGGATAASNGSTDPQKGSKLEWRFLALATHPPCQVEDGKVVKNTPPDHYYDVPESARNLIQIWAVPVQRPKMSTGNGEKSIVKPRLVYAIDHESGVTWDLQWCPLVNKFPKTKHRENILGILAACFGDGSMRVFEIPRIPKERLQLTMSKEQRVVDKNIPIVVAKLPRITQLSVQWSPHTWNILLTGGSDGSVSLWNIKSAVSDSDNVADERTEPEPIEPQRRFQDADTIGKQEAFEWGCGWVAIRAVAWSPFDEHLFATTGNDSVFKVWDVREPRVCLRSHRIRSTWGLALQWMDQTSIQISGDQGSVYMYDILSGSYQKLHFHPQIDSPVWDLQFARRGAVPLLISSCTSGSIRAAPAKKLYRAPQNCIEICRLSGQKDSSIEKPFKSLRISFDKHSVLGSADSVSVSTREFCERDAALHRLRLSSITPGDYPCFLAAGGHAGLVILLEMQETLDTLISTFFMPPSKKTGRPKKIFATVGGHHVPKKKPSGTVKGAGNAGRKARTLGSFAKAKGMHTALSKYKKKALGNGKKKAMSHANAKKKSFIQEDGEVEVDDSVGDEEEPEFEEEDEEEDESDLSLVMGDSSDDDRISVSDNAVEEEEAATNENPEEALLMKEYQLDLSEEDAILLAIQMSTEAVEEKQPPAADTAVVGTLEESKPAKTSKAKAAAAGKNRKKAATAPHSGRRRRNTQEVSEEDAVQLAIQMSKELNEEKQPVPASTAAAGTSDNTKPANNTEAKKLKKTAATSRGRRSNGQHDIVSEDASSQLAAEEKQSVSADKKTAKRSRATGAKSGPAAKKRKTTTTSRGELRTSSDQGNVKSDETLGIQTSKEPVEEKQTATPSATAPITSEGGPTTIGAEAQATPTKTAAPQRSSDDAGVSKESAKASNDPTEEKPAAPASAAGSGSSDGPKPVKNSSSTVGKAKAASKKRKKPTATPRAGRRSRKGQDDIVSEAIQISKELLEEKQPAPVPAIAANLDSNKPTKRSRTGAKVGATVKKRKKPLRSGQESADPDEALAAQVSKEEEKQPTSAKRESKTPAKRPSTTRAKAGATTKRKKTTTAPRGRRRSNNGQADIMSEEDALLLALTISELEY